MSARFRALLADTRPLSHPDFRRLWVANIITVIGGQLTVVAVPAQLYSMTGSSGWVGLTGIFGLVPLLVFGLWGGALADSLDRRMLLVVTSIGLAVTSALFWVQAALGVTNPWVLLWLFALQQAFFALNQPVRTAIVPRLVPARELAAANSLNMTVLQVGAVAGPLVGGILIPVIGFSALYAIDAICLVLAVLMVVRLPMLPPIGAPTKAGLRSVFDGFAYLAKHPVVMMSFAVDIVAMVFGMPRALFPEIANMSFGGPTEGGWVFALLFAAIPLGGVLGGIFSGWVSRVSRHGLAVVIAVIVWGAAITGFGVAVWFAPGRPGLLVAVAVGCLMIGGAADVASAAFRSTILLQAATDDMRGRLQGVFTVVVSGGPRVADLLHGSTAALVGTAVATAGGGVLVIIGTVALALLVPAFVRYRFTP